MVQKQSKFEFLNFIQLLVYFRNFTIKKLLPRFLHVKPKAKPEEIQAFRDGILSLNNIIYLIILLFSFSIGILW
jgi:hypothetical protein